MSEVRSSIGITGLSVAYWRDSPIFSGLALRLRGPGWFQLSAPNGAGKSTLFEVLAGYLDPLAGDVVIGDQHVQPGRRVPGLRLVRDEPAFVPGVTIRDHLHLYARRYGRPITGLLELAGELGLAPHLDKAPHSLSSGSLKKAWLACNWAGDEPVWCLDEPFNGVDVDSVALLVELFVQRASGALLVTTAHQLPMGVELVPASSQYVGAPFTLAEVRHG